jgi:hypothetical protein
VKATFLAADPKALVLPQLLDGIEAGENLDEVRSPLDKKRIHAWLFYVDNLARRVPETIAYDLADSRKQFRADLTFTFRVRMYLEFKQAADLASANREGNALWLSVAKYFSARPRFGLSNRNLRQHFELQRESLTLGKAGENKCFIGLGFIDCLVYEHFTVL